MRRTREIIGPNVVVQVIQVGWDKSSRGGRGAEFRNQMPAVLELPAALAPDVGRHLLIHKTQWGRSNDFAIPIHTEVTVTDAANGFHFRCASVRLMGDQIQLEWTWSIEGGLPPRATWNAPGVAEHTAIARANEWVRARWNGRFTGIDCGNWSYESVVVNAGLCPTTEVPADFFLRTPPLDDYQQMAYLR